MLAAALQRGSFISVNTYYATAAKQTGFIAGGLPQLYNVLMLFLLHASFFFRFSPREETMKGERVCVSLLNDEASGTKGKKRVKISLFHNSVGLFCYSYSSCGQMCEVQSRLLT